MQYAITELLARYVSLNLIPSNKGLNTWAFNSINLPLPLFHSRIFDFI